MERNGNGRSRPKSCSMASSASSNSRADSAVSPDRHCVEEQGLILQPFAFRFCFDEVRNREPAHHRGHARHRKRERRVTITQIAAERI